MTTRIVGLVLAALFGMAGGSVAVLALGESPPSPGPDATDAGPSPRVVEVPEPARASSRLLLAWASSPGLPAHTEQVLERTPGVRGATTVEAGLDWLVSTSTASGNHVREAAAGLAVPVETAVVEPQEYARFVPPADRDPIVSLGRGEAIMSATEELLRGSDDVSRLRMRDRRLAVTGTISDVAASGYEIVVGGTPPASWERVDRFVLMQLGPRASRRRIERRIESLLSESQGLRIRAKGETPYLRHGDAVLPQMLLKETFGEFAAQPQPDGTLLIDPVWRRQNIREIEVPILGTVTCHRTLAAQLRAALQEVARAGLAHLVNVPQFGGCYSPRFINRDPQGRLSHHSWGTAVDLNARDNAFGTRPDQDPRLVKIMEEHGFTWGGRWLIPDGMHFEWVRFP
jgi:D-alanyl-D-alanine carboxypeptidase